MTAPDARAVELWLAQRRAWRPAGLPQNATEAGRRFRCELIGAELSGQACALRHLQHTERSWPTPCQGCKRGQRRVELLRIERAGHHANRRELLDDAYLAQLGKMPDEVLARRAGVRVGAVQRARNDLGIPAHSGERRTPRGAVKWAVQDWTESVHLLARQLWCHAHKVLMGRRALGVEASRWDGAGLGDVPDAVVAARLAMTAADVTRYRERCALPPATGCRRRDLRVFVAWESLDDLGAVPDGVLADRLWVPKSAVARARRTLHIKAKRPKPWRIQRIDWSAQRLGEMPDIDIAEQLGVSAQTVSRHRCRLGIAAFYHRPVLDTVDWNELPLGEATDRQIAAEVGCSVLTVAKARAERDIERWSAAKHIDWDEQPLGIETDKDLARALNVNADTVRAARRERFICSPRPIVLHIDQLRGRGQLGAELAAWADRQRDPTVAGQWMLRALNGDFGTLEDMSRAMGERFTVVTLQRWAAKAGVEPLGVRHRMRLEVIAGRVLEAGDGRGRTYTVAGAAPRPALCPSTATLAQVFSQTPVRELDNGLLRHLLGWDGRQVKRWLDEQVALGTLLKRGRRAGAHYIAGC